MFIDFKPRISDPGSYFALLMHSEQHDLEETTQHDNSEERGVHPVSALGMSMEWPVTVS